jgi:hypothetical protein
VPRNGHSTSTPNPPMRTSRCTPCCCSRIGNFIAAEAQLRQALALDPKNQWAMGAATDQAIFLGELDKALGFAQRGVEYFCGLRQIRFSRMCGRIRAMRRCYPV